MVALVHHNMTPCRIPQRGSKGTGGKTIVSCSRNRPHAKTPTKSAIIVRALYEVL